MIQISFLIPVYNVEEYLPECVNSILCQGETDIEIVLVDDGSTDGSGALCDGFAAEYDCVQVIHQENSGAAAARNRALAQARGEYIAFVDSDDRLASGSIAELIKWIRQGGADMCFLDGVRFFPDGRRIPLGENIIRERIRGKNREAVCKHLGTRPKFSGSACTKIFRRAFLREKQVCFPTARRHGEDLTFCLDCILRAESYDVLTMPYYEYRQGREDSVTATIAEKGFFELLQFVSDTAEKLTVDRQAKDDVCKSMMSVAAYEYVLVIWMYRKVPCKARRKARKAARKFGWVLQYTPVSLFKLVGILTRTVGFAITAWLLDIYKRSR